MRRGRGKKGCVCPGKAREPGVAGTREMGLDWVKVRGAGQGWSQTRTLCKLKGTFSSG